MYEFFLQVVWFVKSLGYFGIFIMTFIESTFIPIPAEITLIPAGYLVQKGEMSGPLVLLVSALGTLGGALANYYIAYFFELNSKTNMYLIGSNHSTLLCVIYITIILF